MDIFNPSIIILASTPLPEGVEGTVGGLLVFISIALGISFLCSILEAVVLSLPISHVELMAEGGERAGLLMQKHRQDVEKPIAAILTLNTIAHTVGAAGAGAQAVALFGNEFAGIITAVLTLLILIFSEIIPKTVGAVYSKQLATFSAYTIEVLVKGLYPAVWASEKIARLLAPDEDAPTVTRSELAVLARISAKEGGIKERENRIFRNLLQLRDVQVETIMTPRTVLMALQQDMTVEEVLEKLPVLPYSRIPIYNEDTDDIVGYVLRHEIFSRSARGEHETPLKQLTREIQAIPETNSVAQVLDEFIAQQDHIFLVIDEYGGTAGIITMEDTVETLLGIEITDESDVVADLRQLARRRYESQRQLMNQAVEASDAAISVADPQDGDITIP